MYIRVPSDPVNPTFDDVFRVPVWRWHSYEKEKRQHWGMRRSLAKARIWAHKGRHRK